MTKSLNQAFIKAYSKEERLARQAAASAQPETSVEESYIVRFDTATVSVAAPHHPQTPSRGTTKQPASSTNQTSVAQTSLTADASSVPAPKLRSAQPSVNVRHAEVIYSNDAAAPPQPATAGPALQPAAPQDDALQTLRESIASQMLQAGSWEFQSLATSTPTQPTHRVDPAPSEPALAIPAPHPATVAPQPAAPQKTVAAASAIEAVTTRQLEQPASYYPPASRPVAAQPDAPVAVNQAVQSQPSNHPEAAPSPVTPAVVKDREPTAVQHHDATVAPASPVQHRVDPVAATADVDSAPNTQAPSTAPQLQPLAEPALPPQHSQRREKDGEIFRLDRPNYDPATSAEDSGEVSAIQDSLSVTSIDELAEISETARVAAREAAAKKAAEAEQNLRSSKKRIFNPVWEVDNFHWPDVCMDLLQQSGEQMDAVAENLSSACEEGLQVLAVTSPEGGEGRTTIACCLAILAGSRGLNVAIVDADLEHPTLALQTNLELDQDWRSAIEHQLPLEEIAVHSIDDQVTLIPLVAPVEHSEMSTDDDRIASMFQELSESFDLVIADMGPMNSPRSLVPTMGEHGIISAVVSVVRRQETAAEQIEACIRRVRQSGIVSIGLVENFVS